MKFIRLFLNSLRKLDVTNQLKAINILNISPKPAELIYS
jgi:hypothetical protein